MGYRRSIKVVMASAMVVLMAVMFHLVGPQIVRFLAGELPRVYAGVVSWLTPPYLYFVINVIIISIAASSRFHAKSEPDSPELESGPEAPPSEVEFAVSQPLEEKEEEEIVASKSTWSPDQTDIPTAAAVIFQPEEAEPEEAEPEEQRTEVEMETAKEHTNLTARPPTSVRFPKRKSAKPSPEDRKLRVARPRKNETLEGTWRAITEGRAVPLARHLKKSDTWDARCRGGGGGSGGEDPSTRKSETFQTERAVARQGSGGRLRREASLGSEDLNRRVEAFINKFNEEMRLQRLESLKHYMEMINKSSD
ncbi:uncharacterized protein [Typha angustifolia]|uniref:uncharacterized protein n=1 Tax=Typha angustifolia TaxID=59011 RepID=UPI003C2F56F7